MFDIERESANVRLPEDGSARLFLSAMNAKLSSQDRKPTAVDTKTPAQDKPATTDAKPPVQDTKPAAAGPKPLSDIQKHVAAFDTNNDGYVTRKELAAGFRAIGYDSHISRLKAMAAQSKFGSLIADLKPDHGGMYNSEGNLDLAKVDALFNGKSSIDRKDIDACLDARHVPTGMARKFISGQFESGFQAVGRDSITRPEFISIMKGDMMKEKILAARSKKK